MEMQGQARLEASRDQVWTALNDPAVLQACIPGCESLEQTDATSYTATVVSKVGPIKARFSGKVTLSNIVPPRSYTLTGEGSGGAAGFAKADIEVALDAVEPTVTLLRYVVKANVGGKLAQLGSRMIDAAARKSADDFFAVFGEQVSSRSGDVAAVAAPAPVAWAAVLGGGESASPAGGDVAVLERPAPPPVVRAAAPVSRPQAPAPQPAGQLAADVMEVLTTEQIKIWIADHIAVVTLNRPTRRNAMTLAMWRAIPAIFAALERNPDVRAVILTGAGDDFCAGADIPEFERVRAEAAQVVAYEVAVDACCDAIANIAKPTIAVVRGYCLGGGAHLAMSCDFRHADVGALFGIPAARLSIIYGVKGTRKLLSLVGLPQAKKILFGAQQFGAAQAQRIGFVDQVSGVAAADVPPKVTGWKRFFAAPSQAPAGDVMADARSFASSLADNAPLSIAGAKHLLNGMAMGTGSLDLDHAEALIAQAAASDDYREGRAAFGEKRAPQFKGH